MSALVGETTQQGGLERLVHVDHTLVWIPSRALTVAPPWAYFMLGVPPVYRKSIDNRNPKFSFQAFRGRVWIHTSGKVRLATYEHAVQVARAAGVPDAWIPTLQQVRTEVHPSLARGAIVGYVEIYDWATPGAYPSPWHQPDQGGFMLRNTYQLKQPVRTGGALGFWRLSHDVACAVARQCPGFDVGDRIRAPHVNRGLRGTWPGG